MLDFAVKLTSTPDKMVEGGRVRPCATSGSPDRDIWDIAALPLLQYVKRIAAATEMRPNREYHYMQRASSGR